MGAIRFFVEDKTMQKFLIDFTLKRFNMQITEGNFVRFGSWSEFAKERRQFEENSDKGGSNLLFIDSDNDFNVRKQYVVNSLAEANIKADFFLFPNDESVGNIETLLASIAVNTQVLNCYAQFEDCLLVGGFLNPSGKTKIYTYTEILTNEPDRKKGKHKDDKRNYLNANWDLDAPQTQSLYNFLAKYIIAI